jgi:hypothetical protein
MKVHPRFGKRLQSSEEVKRLGKKKGIFVGCDDAVTHIVCLVGNGAPYPNEISDDGTRLLYCFSPNSNDNVSMRYNMSRGIAVEVYVSDLSKNETFFWGNAAVTPTTNSIHSKGRLFQRFVLLRKDDVECAVPTNVRPNSSRAVASIFRQTHFKSMLESRVATFFEELKLEWHYEQISVSREDRVNTYTCDFFLPDLPLFVEVKAAYPTKEEVEKAEFLCNLLRVDVAVMYNSKFEPVTDDESVEKDDTVRCLLFSRTESVVSSSCDAVWTLCNDVPRVCPRSISDRSGWAHPILLNAYAKAASGNCRVGM